MSGAGGQGGVRAAWAGLRRRLRRICRREWVKWARQPVSCWVAAPFAVGPAPAFPRGDRPRSATDMCNALIVRDAAPARCPARGAA